MAFDAETGPTSPFGASTPEAFAPEAFAPEGSIPLFLSISSAVIHLPKAAYLPTRHHRPASQEGPDAISFGLLGDDYPGENVG